MPVGRGAGIEPAHGALPARRRERGQPPAAEFLAFLRSLPDSTRLLVAVDAQGEVQATAGCSTFGADASAYFVSTDSRWRGRGMATAVTAAALGWAHETGARRASLDA